MLVSLVWGTGSFYYHVGDGHGKKEVRTEIGNSLEFVSSSTSTQLKGRAVKADEISVVSTSAFVLLDNPKSNRG